MHSARRLWQCKRCGAQTSVSAGTVMHGTRMPLRLWFWAAYLVATHHPGISAVQLQRQLGVGGEWALSVENAQFGRYPHPTAYARIDCV